MPNLVSPEVIGQRIYLIRGHKVMIDRDLASLYKVPTGRLNEQVKRNRKRFPEDFMFQLTKKEYENWISQIAISNSEKMGLRRRPYAFTEHGVAMLASVLNSDKAIKISIHIIKAFVKLRNVISAHKELAHKLEQLERKTVKHDTEIQAIFEAIRQLMKPPEQSKRRIGFHAG